ncbi:unnamed protein product [Somion occarium]|uniref:Uncharacterized protein n=1 Tax=Somion occarium TaxID=3059160 RepID=A0ABP1DFM1_9APHY
MHSLLSRLLDVSQVAAPRSHIALEAMTTRANLLPCSLPRTSVHLITFGTIPHIICIALFTQIRRRTLRHVASGHSPPVRDFCYCLELFVTYSSPRYLSILSLFAIGAYAMKLVTLPVTDEDWASGLQVLFGRKFSSDKLEWYHSKTLSTALTRIMQQRLTIFSRLMVTRYTAFALSTPPMSTSSIGQ